MRSLTGSPRRCAWSQRYSIEAQPNSLLNRTRGKHRALYSMLAAPRRLAQRWAQKLSKADESEGNMKSTMARILVAASLGLCLGANAAFAEEAKTRSTKLDDDKAGSRPHYTAFATGLAEPRGLLVAPSGGLYVAGPKSGSIVKITPDGKITRIADGFVSPHDLAIDATW